MEKGLFQKYNITRTDGKPSHLQNEYFILKVAGQGDPAHIAACRKALLVYAEEVKGSLPELAKDLINRCSNSNQ